MPSRGPATRQVGIYEAKTNLARLVDDAAKGETIMITKHGHPVAMLGPAESEPSRSVQQTVEELRRVRVGKKLGPLKMRELIEKGRS